jgi:hypothetical protein
MDLGNSRDNGAAGKDFEADGRRRHAVQPIEPLGLAGARPTSTAHFGALDVLPDILRWVTSDQY